MEMLCVFLLLTSLILLRYLIKLKIQYKAQVYNYKVLHNTYTDLYKKYIMVCHSSSKPTLIKAIPKGTIEAVKYAMIKSHPDNGGQAEQFIKYKKVYDELTKRSSKN